VKETDNSRSLARVWDAAREHATNAVIGGSILVLTGFTPEHWVAEAVHKLHLPDNLLSRWPAGLDARLIAVSIGIAIIVGDTLWRRRHRETHRTRDADDGESLKSMRAVEAGPEPLHLPSKPSIVVLPFDNLSKDPAEDYFTDGMTEEITTALARIDWLFVIARNSAFTYKNRAVDIKQIGRELGVRYVLEGSVRRSGNRVRITGQLLDAETGTHLWADRFDGEMEEIFELQDNIASSIVGAIEPQMRTAETRRAVSKPTTSLQAYDHFLRALAAFNLLTRESLETTLAECRKAIEADPAYASAYGLFAWCYAWRDAQGWTADREKERAESVRFARLAVEHGSNDPTALYMAGHTLGYSGAGTEEAARIIDRALALNPNSALAWGMKGWVSYYLGDGKTAIDSFNRAMRLSPRDPLGHALKNGIAFAYLIERRFEEALRWADLAIAEQPKFAGSLRVRASSLALLGRTAEAQEAARALLAVDPNFTIAQLTDRAWRASAFNAEYIEGLRKAGVPEG